MTTPLEVVKGALEAAGYPLKFKENSGKPGAVSWVGKCPYHSGKSNDSLTLFEWSDGHVFPYCQSCSQGDKNHRREAASDILGVVGLKYPDDCYSAEARAEWAASAFEDVQFVPDDGRPNKLQVEQTNPKVWLLTLPGRSILRLGSAELQVWGKVATACLEQLETMPTWSPTSGDPWLGPRGLLQTLLDRMRPEDHIEPAPELTVTGRVKLLLASFVELSGAYGATIGPGSIQKGLAWHDVNVERYIFRLETVVSYYQNGLTWAARHHALTRWQIAAGIKDLGGMVSVREYIDGKRQRISWVPVRALELEPE